MRGCRKNVLKIVHIAQKRGPICGASHNFKVPKMGKWYLLFEKVKRYCKKIFRKNNQKSLFLKFFWPKHRKLNLPTSFLRKRGWNSSKGVCKLFAKSVLKNREFEGDFRCLGEFFQDCSLLTKERFCGMLYISKWGNSAQKRERMAECPDFFGF